MTVPNGHEHNKHNGGHPPGFFGIHAKALALGIPTIPVTPPDARLGMGTAIRMEDRGKVPGRYNTLTGAWMGMGVAQLDDWRTQDPLGATSTWDAYPGQQAGVPCGAHPGLDVDVGCAFLAAQIAEFLTKKLVARGLWLSGQPLVRRIGRAPRFLVPLRLVDPDAPAGAAAPNWNIHLARPDGSQRHLIQLLGWRKHYVAHGTHPGTGKPYYWQGVPGGADSPFELSADMASSCFVPVRLDDLAWLHAELTAWLGRGGWVVSAGVAPRVGGAVEVTPELAASLAAPDAATLRGLVAQIPNDDTTFDLPDDRDDWIKMAQALRGALPGDLAAARDIFVEWSGRWHRPQDSRPDVEFDKAGASYSLGWPWLVDLGKKLGLRTVGLGGPGRFGVCPADADDARLGAIVARIVDGVRAERQRRADTDPWNTGEDPSPEPDWGADGGQLGHNGGPKLEPEVPAAPAAPAIRPQPSFPFPMTNPPPAPTPPPRKDGSIPPTPPPLPLVPLELCEAVSLALEPRPVLYGPGYYVRGQASLLVGRGSAGKTALALMEQLSMVLGRPLMGERIWEIGLRIAHLNFDEDTEELLRRLRGMILHHGLAYADTSGLFLAGSDLWPHGTASRLRLTWVDERGRVRINQLGLDNLARLIGENRLDVLHADPLGPLIGDLNNNDLIYELMCRLGDVAKSSGCSISLTHHTRKITPGEDNGGASADQIKGASSLVQGVRFARMITPMTAREATAFNVPERDAWRYVRTDNAKANHSAPRDTVPWFRLNSVCLNNAAGGRDADWIGVPVPWTPPAGAGGLDDVALAKVLAVFEASAQPGAMPLNDAPNMGDSLRCARRAVSGALDCSLERAGHVIQTLIDRRVLERRKLREPVNRNLVGAIVVAGAVISGEDGDSPF